MDAGFIQAGFQCLKAFDIDKRAVDVHNSNLGKTAEVADLRLITAEQLLSNGQPDVVVAGSPCQGFSTLGKRELHDPRNSLLLRAGELALRANPKVFVAENVAGALAGDHKFYWFTLEDMLRDRGYSTTTLKLNASNVGLAQRRARAILIAWRGSGEPALPQHPIQSISLRAVLAGVDRLPNHEKEMLKLGSHGHKIAKRIGPGQKLCNVRGGTSSIHTWDIPEVFGATTKEERAVLEATLFLRRRDRKREWGDADPISVRSITKEVGFASNEIVKRLIDKGYMRRIGTEVDLLNTFNGKYKRLGWDSVSLTVDTKFGDARFFLHPDEHRGFTVREAARIQGFSDNFLFPSERKESFRMIGNAVPPPMGKHIADGLKYLL